ncbi:MAG: DUF1080 domain-containing protein [Christiangramia sp.]|nr:DUF1080 domain-containing protein [Christiangramia sp.]
MKNPLLYLFLVFFIISPVAMAQKDYPTTPPDKSPMPMKPEMTEIWEPKVEVVNPGDKPGEAPSDAIILFNGKDLNNWVSQKDTAKAAPWKIKEGYFEVIPGTGGIQTKMKFGDVQLHIEWSAPDRVENSGQGRGNSGLFFQNRYELQILDSYNNRTYSNGQAASIYKDHPPLVNAMRSPEDWNTYDVIYTAPRFKDNGKLDSPARITVLLNGVVVQNNATINGLTLYTGLHNYPEAHGEDVISLQDHGTPVQFRNIWVRKL